MVMGQQALIFNSIPLDIYLSFEEQEVDDNAILDLELIY